MNNEPIAIIGMGCRFPGGVYSPGTFWQALLNRMDAIAEIPQDRFDLVRYYDARPAIPGRVMTRWGGFLDEIDRFDPLFFGMSPREAERLDPQQRLLLEVGWEALEDAGQVPNSPQIQQTGVFVGMWLSDFEARLFRDPAQVDFYMTTGSGRYSASGRLSYVLGLQGPSLTIDTACSSSLVAVHLATQSLRAGECRLALAGGANVILQPHITIAYSQSRMMAPDGRCKFGDARANGYVRSEGAGLVVLKRLSDALADGDLIYAVILGSATNNDGRSSGFLTTPGGAGQEEMLHKAYQNAGIAPGAVQYVEAHGTGTAAGDPVEIGALGAVLGEGRLAGQFCTIGSVKTNFGHTEGAAGIAGLMKVALALRHRILPASLHFQTPSTAIPWDDIPVRIQSDETAWPAEPGRAVGGVSSFGIAGTNAHVVLGEAPSHNMPPVPRQRGYVLPLSGRSPAALREMGLLYLADAAQHDLHDLAYTLGVRRAHHPVRAALVAGSTDEIIEQLKSLSQGETRRGLLVGPEQPSAKRKIVFVFPGQGGQWIGMGRQLYAEEAAFREAIAACEAAMQAFTDWSLVEYLHADPSAAPLDDIDVVQPMLFALQVALAALWRAWGIEPDAVIGHSMGEVAAAHVAGILSLEDAAHVICRRSQLMKRVSGRGAMAMVELSLSEAQAALAGYEDRLSVAVTNSARSCVLSGDPTALAQVIETLQSRDVFCRSVKVDVAAHSPHMDALHPELVKDLYRLTALPASVPVYSTVTGEREDGGMFDAAYWGRNLREPVLFANAVNQALTDGSNTFVEIGPHPVLLPAVERSLSHDNPDDAAISDFAAVASMKRGEDERQGMLEALAALYVHAYPVDWGRLYPAGGGLVRLPAYPWQREVFWAEAALPVDGGRAARHSDISVHPLLGTSFRPAGQDGVCYWETEISLETLPFLGDHRVNGNSVMPGAAFVEMALTGLAEVSGAGTVEELRLHEVLLVAEKSTRTVQTVLMPTVAGSYRFQCLSRPADDIEATWTLHASGTVRSAELSPKHFSLDAIQATMSESVPSEAHYAGMAARGLSYGLGFQRVVRLWLDAGRREALAEIATPEAAQTHRMYRVHPALLDAAFQLLVTLLPPGNDTWLPVSVAQVELIHPPEIGSVLWAYAVRSAQTEDSSEGDVFLLDSEGVVVLAARGLRLQRVARSADLTSLLYTVEWQLKPLAGHIQAKTEPPGSWLILSDAPIGAALASRLQAMGETCIMVEPGEQNAELEQGHFMVDAEQPDFSALLKAAFTDMPPCRGVVNMWGLDSRAPTEANGLYHTTTFTSRAALNLVQALAQSGWAQMPRLWLVTRGTQPAGSEVSHVAGAPLWGFGAVLGNEHTDMLPVRIDLSADGSTDDLNALFDELWLNDGEDQIALRGTTRYAARLTPYIPPAPTMPVEERWVATTSEQPFRVEVASPGIFDNLRLRAVKRRTPGAGEVEIEVVAAGLNFKDVMNALGTLPGHDNGIGPLGIECAGRIAAVGVGVTGFTVGDSVVAVAFNALASHVVTDARMVARIPPGMTFAEAASIPIVFLTAYHALFRQARLESGERVLIHSAAGGVGLAAVQLAQKAGAEVFATAGNDEKREFLRSLGVMFTSNSRSLAFADDVLNATGGEGVDVVLNALAGEAISKGLAVLRPYGRFVEIGRRDIYRDSHIGLLPFQNNLSYFAVDLEHMMRQKPAALGTMLGELMARFAARELTPIPVQVFAMSEVAEAFRYMAAGRHIGKIVLTLDDAPLPITAIHERTLPIHGDASYLITGGLGGLGLTVARWLVEHGARHLVLTGRHAPDERAQESSRMLENLGAEVLVAQVDVTDAGALADLLAHMAQSMPPLRGVVHAAGLLDDSLLMQMNQVQFRHAAAPKIEGAWNLHELTLDVALDFFVLFSSVAAQLGLAGQANYAAGNAFLDAVAQYRRTLGLPALSINWGPWSEVGLAAAEAIRGDRLAARGLDSISPAEGVAALEFLLLDGVPQASVMAFNSGLWAQAYPGAARSSLLAKLMQADAVEMVQADAAIGDIRAALLTTEPGRPRRSLLENHIREQVAQVLRIAPSRIAMQQPLRDLGIDSLLTLELRNRLESSLKLSLSATLIFNYPTVAALTNHLADKMSVPLDVFVPATPSVPTDTPDVTLGKLDQLSRHEVEALLAEELDSLDDLLKGP